MLVTLSGIVIFVRLLQPMKALLPMLVTLSGIVIFVRPVHPRKAPAPILVRPSPIVMLVRLVHSQKALSPMLLTPSGIVMLVRLVRRKKAALPMLVTGLPLMVSGMTISPDASLSHRVIVTASPCISYVKTERIWLHPDRTAASDMDNSRTGLIMGRMPAA